MNISCISCPARYGVPDAKVVGKRVRITCKRCGTVLLVDGTVNPPRIASGANAGPSVVPVARTSLPPSSPSPARHVAPKPSVEFLVVMPDDRQENADVAQIVRLYRDRQINAESLVWCEGMDEWKAVWDVEEIAAAFRRMGYTRPSQPTARPSRPAQASYDDTADDASTHVVPSSHPPATAAFDDDEATSVVDSSRLALQQPVGGYGRLGGDDDDPTGVVPSPMDLALSPSAHRAPVDRRSSRPAQRASGRSDRPSQRAVRAEPTPSPEPAQSRQQTRARAQTRERQQGLDLFAAEAERQARRELAPAVDDDAARLTGARGENSVLFSLDALVRQEQHKQRPIVLPPRARTDESVLVDSSPSLPSGVAGSALVAPDFTAPVSAPPPRMATAMEDIEYPAQKKGGGWLLPTGVILVAGAAVGGWMSGKLQPLLKAAGVPVSVPTVSSAAPASSAAPKPSAEQAASAEPEASAAPSASAAASAAPSASAVAQVTKPKTPREPGAAAPKSSEEKAGEEAPAPKEEAAAKPSGGGEFDTASAKTALTAAANNASSCREAAGPMGSGKVSITFAPSGRPTSVAVTGDLAGTSVGSCVARLFRAVRVPPFSGEPVSVSKAFSVK